MVSGNKRGPEQWRRVVFRESGLAPLGCRLFLVYIADHMDSRRVTSRPRHLIAADLGVSERAVCRYVEQAHEAGFLTTLVRGHKGITAVYQGTFPTAQREHRVRPETPVQQDTRCPAETPVQQDNFGVQQDNLLPAENDQTCPAETPFSRTHAVVPIESTTHREFAGCDTCHGWGCERCADN